MIDVAGRQLLGLHETRQRLHDVGDRELEDLHAVHVQVIVGTHAAVGLLPHLPRCFGRGPAKPSGRDVQTLETTPVRHHFHNDFAGARVRLEQRRRAAVPQQENHVLVLLVAQLGLGVARQQEHPLEPRPP